MPTCSKARYRLHAERQEVASELGAHVVRHNHVFLIDSVQRGDAASEVMISWDDDELELEEAGELSFTVPPLGDFKVMSCKVLKEPAQAVVINFSDPVGCGSQDLTGLHPSAAGS